MVVINHEVKNKNLFLFYPVDSTLKLPNRIESRVKQGPIVNDNRLYETSDNVLECIDRNEAESGPKNATAEPSAYACLQDNKESEDIYQSLQNLSTSADLHRANETRDDAQAAEYEMQRKI